MEHVCFKKHYTKNIDQGKLLNCLKNIKVKERRTENINKCLNCIFTSYFNNI